MVHIVVATARTCLHSPAQEEEEEEEAPVAVASGTQRIGGRSRAPLRFGLPFGRKAEEEVDEEEEEEEEDDEEVSAPVGKGPLAALFGVAKQPQPKPAAEGVEDARAARQAEAESKCGCGVCSACHCPSALPPHVSLHSHVAICKCDPLVFPSTYLCALGMQEGGGCRSGSEESGAPGGGQRVRGGS